ncbi:MAG TPA: TlpA disulfide reductase family protein [Ktedonobacterales bacterium]|jgi:peroxiredoxin
MKTKTPPGSAKRRASSTSKQPKVAATHPKTAPNRAASAHTKTNARQSERLPEQQPAAQRQHAIPRRRQSLGQRLTHLSGGSWLALVTGVLLVGIIVFAVISTRSSGTTPSGSSQALLTSGTTAPAINSLKAADGNTYSLSQYQGKVVVLELFAPWCPHCQDETATLKQIQQNDASQGVQVLSVSASPYGRNYESGDQTPISMSDIQWFSTTYGLNYPALFDPSLNAANDYHVQAFPTIYVINAQGVITYAGDGEINYASLQQQITQALNQ